MSDRFTPLSREQLSAWIFDELAGAGSIFGVPREGFFVPRADDPFRLEQYGQALDTPFGVAAGPHSQLAPNLVVAFLCGARFMELKTVQTLDTLEVSKPCIDMQDEGYNCEWSQELRIEESFEEYLRAWVLIHALHRHLGFPGPRPGVLFNVSVGYDLAGLQQPNMQWFLEKVRGAPGELAAIRQSVAAHLPWVEGLEIPEAISDNVTLSTMHGCPPEEIESLARHLLDQGFHTSVKLNPTLLGPERVRALLGERLGYQDIVVPDEAFEHDLRYEDALPMLERLAAHAAARGRTFGVKLSNTLEVENHRAVFPPKERRMYLSGRPLHALTTHLAATLERDLPGRLPMSFAGGADAFNVVELLAAGMQTVTVCSDLLKSGGYLRMLQYLERTREEMAAAGAESLGGLRRARAGLGALPEAEAARANLARYAGQVAGEPLLHQDRFHTAGTKTRRALHLFDCVKAPCTDACAVDQKVPDYMRAVREGRYEDAAAIIREDNPIPTILGRICDRKCQDTCIRSHYDDPLAIREIKRFVVERVSPPASAAPEARREAKIAVVGAGPCGFAAAQALARAGYPVTVLEQHQKPGGMVSGTIPSYRLPQAVLDQDLAGLSELGVEVRYGLRAGRDFSLEDLRAQGFAYVVLAVGAQVGKRLGVPGEDVEGIHDAIEVLRRVRDGAPPELGERVGVVGAGDVAMDAARTAFRLGKQVSLIYRRTVDQMPADPEEIEGLLEEGIQVHELFAPTRVLSREGRLTGLLCQRMALGPKGADGRRRPVPVQGEERIFELDALLLAVSQVPVLDFFGEGRPELTAAGHIAVEPQTLETSVPGVFSGGDVALDGPASAVRAAGDGKRIAQAIRAREEGEASGRKVLSAEALAALTLRRAHRDLRAPLKHRPADDRRNFEEVLLTLTEEEAQTEAARCLDCDRVCSLCVSVCPNRAFLTWTARPFEVDLPELTFTGGALQAGAIRRFTVDQAPQVAVVADLCNECGNCETFCPTAGRPYRDKPRLYFDTSEFLAQRDNAFMSLHAGGRRILRGRFAGATHTLELDGELVYRSPQVVARFDPRTFAPTALEGAPALGEGEGVSLAPAAVLFALLEGLRLSLAYLPSAGSPSDQQAAA